MTASAAARCTAGELGFRLPDPGRAYTAVRLRPNAAIRDVDFAYDTRARCWRLRLPRPGLWRLEYTLELTHRDGRVETVCDPGNPRRVPGAFGAASELRCPDYREPSWLRLPATANGWRAVPVPLPGGTVPARVWSPPGAGDRVLLAHDGPDYDAYGALGRYAAALVGAGRLPPFHLVLLPAGDRLEWYSADPRYARVLVRRVLPALTTALGGPGRTVLAGASLGALAALHAQRRHPDAFAGLFLQSGSYFQPRHDRHESGFRRWLRIVRFVSGTLRGPAGTAVPTTLTCGAVEENRANNADMAAALAAQGYPVAYAEVPDAHTWVGWRDALDPHLTDLLHRVWGAD